MTTAEVNPTRRRIHRIGSICIERLSRTGIDVYGATQKELDELLALSVKHDIYLEILNSYTNIVNAYETPEGRLYYYPPFATITSNNKTKVIELLLDMPSRPYTILTSSNVTKSDIDRICKYSNYVCMEAKYHDSALKAKFGTRYIVSTDNADAAMVLNLSQ
jgi:hypothetical protein